MLEVAEAETIATAASCKAYTQFFHSSNNTTNDNLYDFLILLPCVFCLEKQQQKKKMYIMKIPSAYVCVPFCAVLFLNLK